MRPADEERELFAASVPVSREIVLYAVATLAGSTIWLWPHFAHFSQVPDRGDPIFSAWRLARFAHQLATDPQHLFDGNIFYPHLIGGLNWMKGVLCVLSTPQIGHEPRSTTCHV